MNVKNVFCFLTLLFICSTICSAANPANPNMNTKARQLLNYFEALTNSNNASDQLILGCHDFGNSGIYSNWTTSRGHYLGSTPNEYVGLIEYDLSLAQQYVSLPQMADYGEEFTDLNGILSVAAHMCNPALTGSNPCINNQPYNSWSDLDDMAWLLNPNNGNAQAYNWFWSQIQDYGDFFEDLQDRDMIALFRPFHEMSGSWFWWGWDPTDANRINEYKQLWQMVFNYMKNDRGLNNIIWVYSPNVGWDSASKERITSMYPGDGYVDVVALDIYIEENVSWTENFNRLRDSKEQLLKIWGPNNSTWVKPAALGEWGYHGSQWNSGDFNEILTEVKDVFPEAAFATSWNRSWSYYTSGGQRTQAQLNSLFNDPYTITLSNLDVTSTPNPNPPNPNPNPNGSAISSSADTYIRFGNNANSNYGSENKIEVRNSSEWSREGIIKFPIGNGTLNNATLKLNVTYLQNSNATTHTLYVSSNDNWDESTINSNTGVQNALGSPIGSWSGMQLGQEVLIDVTDAVNNKISSGGTNITFVIKSNSNTFIRYASKEHTTSSLQPKLIVDGGGTTNPPPPSGYRYLRLSLDSGINLSIQEVEWFVGNVKYTKQALTKNQVPNNLGEVMITGAPWDSQWKLYDNNNATGRYYGAPDIIDLDLGVTINPTQIRIVKNANWATLSGFTASGSNDGINWNVIRTFSGLSNTDYPGNVGIFNF